MHRFATTVTRTALGSSRHRDFMSTLTLAAPDDLECRFLLILGKPGGGKGTISEKILDVRNWPALARIYFIDLSFHTLLT